MTIAVSMPHFGDTLYHLHDVPRVDFLAPAALHQVGDFLFLVANADCTVEREADGRLIVTFIDDRVHGEV